MWILNSRFITNWIRRWLYVCIVGFWLVGILLPISLGAYLTFYKLLIPQEMIRVPLSFMDGTGPGSIPNEIKESYNDLRYLISEFAKQKDVNYLMSLSLEFHCNRNRNDDILPILSTVSVENTPINASKQVILNCDTRYIYNGNNNIIPYNLRYWVPPILIDIDKKVHLNSDLLVVNSNQLVEVLDNPVKIELLQNVIVNHDNTYLEFIIQWDGFRYYITKYYYRSLVVGVATFYIAALIQIFFFNMIFMISNSESKKGSKTNGDDSASSSDFEVNTGDVELNPKVKLEPGTEELIPHDDNRTTGNDNRTTGNDNQVHVKQESQMRLRK